MTKENKAILKVSSILLVEDDVELRNKFTRLLSLYVDTIYVASNGLEGLKLYEKHNPSIIITDIETPQMNGLEFIKIIRQKNMSIPIIITTAYSNKEYLLDAIKLLLVDYLVKPIDFDFLNKALNTAVNQLSKHTLKSKITINGLTYDFKNKEASFLNTTVRLSKTESALLELLILHRGNLVCKNTIEEKIYPNKYMSDTAIKNVVFKLRKKIGLDIIVTVDKIGYKIEKE